MVLNHSFDFRQLRINIETERDSNPLLAEISKNQIEDQFRPYSYAQLYGQNPNSGYLNSDQVFGVRIPGTLQVRPSVLAQLPESLPNVMVGQTGTVYMYTLVTSAVVNKGPLRNPC